jgi:hypothetical protein
MVKVMAEMLSSWLRQQFGKLAQVRLINATEQFAMEFNEGVSFGYFRGEISSYPRRFGTAIMP